jgi:molybdenum cofactor biosynthesis enzyme MoaA
MDKLAQRTKAPSSPGLWANNRLRLAVTAACNISCIYCHNEGQPQSKAFMSKALFEHVIQLISCVDPTLASVTFTGGEPLLHPELETFLSQISPLVGVRTVITNGWLLDSSRLRTLRQAGVNKIRVGVDSLVHAKSRPTPGRPSDRRIVDVIAEVRDASVAIELNVVLSRFSLPGLLHILDFCVREGISAKFFECVGADFQGIYRAVPAISRLHFDDLVRSRPGFVTAHPCTALGAANEVYKFKHCTLRYCSFLCPHELCAVTGTRIDPLGHVYACMNHGATSVIRPEESLRRSSQTIRTAISVGCHPNVGEFRRLA